MVRRTPDRVTLAALLLVAALWSAAALPAAGLGGGGPAHGLPAGGQNGVATDGGPTDPRTATDHPPTGSTASSDPAGLQVDADATVLRFALRPDGRARVTFEYRVRLDDENTTAAFESLREDVETNRSAYADRFEERIAGTVAEAENATGRPMAVRNVTVEASRSLDQAYGVVTYRFTWTGFAAANGTHVVAGDALSGLFLAEDTRLLVSWPGDYSRVAVAPPPDDDRTAAVVWRGPVEFAPGEPRVVVASEPTPTPTPAGPDGDDRRPATSLLLAVAAGGLVAAGAAALLLRRRAGGGGGGGSDPPPELLSNEEQVLRLLEERGGRVKQQDVVSALSWTEAKTSQVVGDLRDEGEVEVFRIGRENVVALPDEER